MSLAASEAATLGPSKEQLAYDAKQLDKQQLALNWQRARVFARYFGGPDAKKQDLVLADWVVPLDTKGRPVPAWLAFQPTNVLATQQLAQLPAAPSSSSPANANANGMANGTDAGDAVEAHADEEQARNALAIQNLVALAKLTSGPALVESDEVMQLRLRATDVFPKGDKTGESLAAALAPLNTEQSRINTKRQMLSFRMETGTPIGGGGEHFDSVARATTTWSTLGRPMTGWLHWGNDNNGGYFNPSGGGSWDPHVVNPASLKGTFGPATNAWVAKHPHAEELGASEMGMRDLGGDTSTQAGSGLFGA